MKYLKGGIVCFILLIIGYFVFGQYIDLYFKGSYTYVFEGDKDDSYDNLLFVKKVKGIKESDQLVKTFLNAANNDLLTKESAIRYINEFNRKEYLPYLLQVKEDFQKMNIDSTWEVKVTDNYSRSCKLRNAYVSSYLDETIKKIK
ncbi:hypothetical protein [Ferruginibacter sp.]